MRMRLNETDMYIHNSERTENSIEQSERLVHMLLTHLTMLDKATEIISCETGEVISTEDLSRVAGVLNGLKNSRHWTIQ